jgi:hypothetical protein
VLTEKKARQLRMRIMETESFHDAMTPCTTPPSPPGSRPPPATTTPRRRKLAAPRTPTVEALPSGPARRRQAMRRVYKLLLFVCLFELYREIDRQKGTANSRSNI